MNKYKFNVNYSDGTKAILEIEALDFYEARESAYRICYRSGLCFEGRV
jgi:L-fucose mutarotase/ribose pyranase (RbsD/FucU family)